MRTSCNWFLFYFWLDEKVAQVLKLKVPLLQFVLEWSSTECRETKTKVVILANHKDSAQIIQWTIESNSKQTHIADHKR